MAHANAKTTNIRTIEFHCQLPVVSVEIVNMKAKVLTILITGAVLTGFGQGQVYIANTFSTRIKTNYTIFPGAGTSGDIQQPVGSYIFALFSAPSSMVSGGTQFPFRNSLWTFTGSYAQNTSAPGRIAAFGTTNADGSVSIPGYVAGSTVSLLVMGWEAAYGGNTLQSFYDALKTDQWGNISGVGIYGESEMPT